MRWPDALWLNLRENEAANGHCVVEAAEAKPSEGGDGRSTLGGTDGCCGGGRAPCCCQEGSLEWDGVRVDEEARENKPGRGSAGFGGVECWLLSGG